MTGILGIKSHSDYESGDVVPSSYFNRKIENFIFTFSGGSVSAVPLQWQELEALQAPWACDVVKVTAWVHGVATGGSIDVFEGASSILSAPIALASKTHVAGTITDPSIAQGADLSCQVLAQGNLYRVKVTVTVAVD